MYTMTIDTADKQYRTLTDAEVRIALGINDQQLYPTAFHRDYHKKLKTNLIIPSFNQNSSCAVEFMTKWFYNKFPDDFFKTKYIESSNILDQVTRRTKKDLLIATKPAATIRANVNEISYNRDQLSLQNYGTLTYTNRARYNDAFFIDRDKSLFMSIGMDLMKSNFSFRMLLPYQGIGLDIARSCIMWFRSGTSEKHYLDMDFHVPSELLEQLAKDLGFGDTICPYSGRITDAVAFCHEFNKRSKLMLAYKFNAGTGTYQYFLKVPHCYFHIKTGEVQVDEGNRKGHLVTDYIVNFESEVEFVCPKFYAYYSYKQLDLMSTMDKLDARSFIIKNTSLAKVPNKNAKGWPWITRTEYNFNDEEAELIKKKQLMHIDFEELIGDLRVAIDMTKHIAISPSVFLDIQVFSGYRIVSTEIDWQNYRINILEPLPSANCYLIIYMDNNYYYEQVTNYKQYEKERVSLSQTNIEHKRLDYKKNLKRTSLGRDVDKVRDTNVYLDSAKSDNKPDTGIDRLPDGCLYKEDLLNKSANT